MGVSYVYFTAADDAAAAEAERRPGVRSGGRR
jgi:hypothetical protein